MGVILRTLGRWWLMINPLGHQPTDAQSAAAAATVQQFNAQYLRLNEGNYLPRNGEPGFGRLLQAFRLTGEAEPVRDLIRAANDRGIGVLGIRAVQAGALTDAFDRDIPEESADMADYHRVAGFRALARELGQTPADLAHRYALSMPSIATVVLGIKNRDELNACLAAEAAGPLAPELIERIDASVRS